jgi:hypothetical protein
MVLTAAVSHWEVPGATCSANLVHAVIVQLKDHCAVIKVSTMKINHEMFKWSQYQPENASDAKNLLLIN